MTAPTSLLPILGSGSSWTITPTDVTQFVRLEQCERFFRFRIAERNGQKFMREYDVVPQRITPLLSLSGYTFEEGIEKAIAGTFSTVHYADLASHSHARPHNNDEVAEKARNLNPGEAAVLFQPRLHVELDGWFFRGDVDLVRLERTDEGKLEVLIVDIKSSTKVKVEHRLQVAFYTLMLDKILQDAAVSHELMKTGVLYRPVADPTDEEILENQPCAEAVEKIFGLEESLLEIVAEPEAYLQSAHDLGEPRRSQVGKPPAPLRSRSCWSRQPQPVFPRTTEPEELGQQNSLLA
ncbi:MAG: CRISPR-associated protein Cas4, partial [Planctomycetales bacterium]